MTFQETNKTKTCKKCGMRKFATLEYWYRDMSKKDGVTSACKECIKKQQKERYNNNLEKERERSRIYHENNREKELARSRAYYHKNRDKQQARQKEYYGLNVEKLRSQKRVYCKINRSEKNLYEKRKRKIDPSFKVSKNIRARMRAALKGATKSSSTIELLGCSVEQWIEYLQSRFERGMSWENYGTEWHIDHIRPCASFDLTDPEQQKQCFHFTNTRPMWKRENLMKGAKWNS